MVLRNKVTSRCIVCRTELNGFNTKVVENPRYLKYRSLVCNTCFDEYYPIHQDKYENR